MAKTQFTDAADRTAWVDENGMVWTQGGKNPTYYTRDEWDARQLDRWGTSEDRLADEVSDYIIELQEKLDSIPGVSLSQDEMDAFLQKAIDQVTPYYDEKRKEVEAGIKEGKIRGAEDLLSFMREVRADVETNLANLDIDQAQTEEDFINRLADITATKEEDVATKRYQWGERIRDAKQSQVEKGTLTSGIGRQEVGRLTDRQAAEEQAVERSAGAQQTALETGQKFDLERIALARETVQKERERQLGTSEQEQATQTKALGTLGYTSMSDLPSQAELQRLRNERNVKVYDPTALTDLEEERKRAIESRKLTLQEEELAARREKERREREKIQSELDVKKQQYSYLYK